ncbi:hypothetical protein DL93DRAFT_1352021 [Clavulina sp. PMI_390]|nr:hypothetical protein DL93DRAFT_1352021 [Clavulina sp. PMI_390]
MASCQILSTKRQEAIVGVVLPRVPSHEAFKQRCSIKAFLETIETDDNRTNGKFGKVKRPANGFLSFRNYLQERREEIKKEIRDANAGTTIQPIVPLSDDSNAERAKFLWASLPSDVQDQWKLLKTWGQEYINSIYPNYQYSPVSWYIVNLATLQPVSQDVSSMIYEQAKARVARIDKERKLVSLILNHSLPPSAHTR